MDVPKDATVIPEVRQIVRDHAIDEGTHHSFFAAFFTRLWGELSPAERTMVTGWLPDLIIQSLQPATTPTANALRAAGLPEPKVRTVIAESFTREAVLAGIRRASAKTVKVFQAAGILDTPLGYDGFARACLTPIDG
jgi:hypothetical protein